MSEAAAAGIQLAQENAARAKVAGHADRVWKDECMFCFCTPRSTGGLYVNLSTFQGFCQQHLSLDHQRTGGVLYLHQQSSKVSE